MIFGKHINKYYLKYGWMLILGIFALVIVDYGQLKIPEFYRAVVNGMNTGVVEANGGNYTFDMEYLLDKICLPMIFIILLIVVGRFLWRVCFFGAAIKVETALREEMFDHSRKLSQQYYQVNKVGNLMSLFTNDLETVQDCYGSGVLVLFDALVLGSMTLVKMLNMDIILTALSLIPMIILFTMASIVGKTMSKKWDKRQEAFSRLSDFAQESFSGIAVIKAFAKEGAELLAFRWLNKDNEKANVEYTKVSTMLNVLITLFVESIVGVILGYGGYLIHAGKFDAGKMIEFIGYFTAIVWPIEAISLLIEMSAKGKASLQRISELLDNRIDVKDIEELISVNENIDISGKIEFRNLTFTYPGNEKETLKNISFIINPGERVGIIGRTGAGKTTIVDLIARIYNVDEGMLFVDGRDVNSIPIENLRKEIAYVPQDNFLFSDTVANNIGFSEKMQLDYDKIRKAATLADVDGNIKDFSHGYDTMLGERGVTVSGGQKQRISIARALMKDAKILILDDSVSAVDTKTEKTILENISGYKQGITTILIAHRISTIKQMDKVLFVEDGCLVDYGKHDELLNRCEKYARMVELQKLEEDKGNE